MALVLGPLSFSGPPAQAATGAATWSLDETPGQLGFGEVDTISCPDPTYCVALASNQYQDDSLILSAGTWNTAPLVEPGGALQLNSVSCSSDSFCTAVGERSIGSGTSSDAVGVIEEWDGSAWSMAPNPQSSGVNVWLSSVSCPSAARCFAVGQDSTDGGFIDSWNGASWTMAFSQQDVSLSGVSCSTPTTCVTVGAGSSNSLYSMVLGSGTWAPESVPDPGNDGFLYDVSCASPTFCMAVGSVQVGGVGWATSLTEDWNGESWVVVPSPNYPEDDLGPGFIGGGILIADSCVSAQACVAVGYGGGGVNSSNLGYPGLAVVETWDGVAWSLTPTPAPVEPAGGGHADLRGVSCMPDANDAQCVAVGLQTPDNANFSALVATTSAAVGSLDATSTQIQSDGAGDLTATVATGAPSQATPTGSVTILNDGLPISSCPPLELDSGQASCSAGAGVTGQLTADYSGDATFDGSSSQQIGTLPIAYVGNGATSGTVPVDGASPYSSSATVTVLGPGALLRAGYNFSGWNTKPDGSGSSYAPGATFTILTSTELFAVWTPREPQTSTPALSASTSRLNFRGSTLGTYVGPLSVTLTNTSSTTDQVTGYELSGDNDFLFDNAQSQCSSALSPGASCVLEFDFLPGALGTRTENVTVIDTANSAITISLTGVGTIGYYQVTSQGAVGYAGDAAYYGEITSPLNKPIVAIAPTGDDGGYWLVGADGGVFSFGDAGFYGSTGGIRLNRPIVGMTADGAHGYWFVASDGGVFNYGSARFYGSTGAMRLNKPIVGMAATADGGGYWLVASDGGIFAYGDAHFYGSFVLNKSIVGMVPTPDDGGYWLVASDGGVFSYGDARFFGSTGSIKLVQPIVGMAAMPDGGGYWFSATDGGLFNYGTAPFYGSGVDSGFGQVAGMATDGVATIQAQGRQPAVRILQPKEVPTGVAAGTPRFAGPKTSGIKTFTKFMGAPYLDG